ncbi:hypothetical protein Tco_0131669, partial [Tanacetum coccineum]
LEKLKNENVSLDFKVQSLIKERDNAKMEYKKLFDSIKKTRSQTQKEMDELIVHVSEKTYAYGVIRAENQNLLSTIFELKTRLEKVEKGMDIQKESQKQAKPSTGWKSPSQAKAKISLMKKIQLEGLKLPNLKLYYKRKRQGLELQTGRSFAMRL